MAYLPPELRLATIEQVLALPSVPFSNRWQLPEQPGVYVVLNGDAVLYVGEAFDSIRKRWRAHNKRTQAEALGADRIAYMVCGDGRWWAEEYAVFHLQPPLNVHYKKRCRRFDH